MGSAEKKRAHVNAALNHGKQRVAQDVILQPVTIVAIDVAAFRVALHLCYVIRRKCRNGVPCVAGNKISKFRRSFAGKPKAVCEPATTAGAEKVGEPLDAFFSGEVDHGLPGLPPVRV